MALKIRRGTDAERAAGNGVVFAEGELIYVTDTDALYIGDGVTPGGILLANSELGDLSAYITANSSAGNDGELELNKPLNLNNQDIIGTGNINIAGTITATGNINIGDNVTEDTVTLLAKVDSNITPKEDSQYDLGTTEKRWQNVYATGLVVDGQIDAVSIKANTVADNSTVMVNVANNTFTGNLTGNVSGTLIGNVTGDVTGTLNGNVIGDVTGSVFADNSTTLVDGVEGVLRGDHYGSLFGSVKALNNGFTILNPGTNGTDASIVATVIGNVTGNVSGNVSGDVQGNVVGNTTGFHTGDVKGSVFADNSTILVDAVAGIIPGTVISGTVTADLIGNVTGNLIGDVNASTVLASVISTEDSSPLIFQSPVTFRSDIFVENDLRIDNTNKLLVNEILSGFGGDAPVFFNSNVEINRGLIIRQPLQVDSDINSFGTIASTTGIGVGVFIDEFTPPVPTTVIANTIANFGTPVKFQNITTVQRDELSAEAGMVIFNTTDTKLQVCTVGGLTPTWVNLH
jgi:hypothetical protein